LDISLGRSAKNAAANPGGFHLKREGLCGPRMTAASCHFTSERRSGKAFAEIVWKIYKQQLIAAEKPFYSASQMEIGYFIDCQCS
jgi:hypothetical protein